MNRRYTFDNLGAALLVMFVLCAQDNWADIMWGGVDAVGPGLSPIVGFNEGAMLFFVIFIIVGGFFVLNIFVGVFIDNYNASTAKITKEDSSLSSQSDRDAGVNAPPPPDAADSPTRPPGLRGVLFDATMNDRFDLFIAAMIVFNIVAMAFESHKMSQWQTDFGATLNLFFSLVFGAEAVAKMLALTPRGYLSDGWSRFDLLIVNISFLGVLIDSSGTSFPLNPTILRVLRVFRVFRILRAFRLFKAAKGLNAIVATLGASLPAIANLAGLLLLLFFVYGILGVNLFGDLCASDDADLRCRLLDLKVDNHASFRNVGVALLTLFRVATSDNWGDIMVATRVAPLPRPDGAIGLARSAIAAGAWDLARTYLPGCVTDDELAELGVQCRAMPCASTCGSGDAAVVYFLSFVALANFTLMNLVVAVLMQQLSEVERPAGVQMLSDNVDKTTFRRIVLRWLTSGKKKRLSKTREKKSARQGTPRVSISEGAADAHADAPP
jgi:hypothetical protein